MNHFATFALFAGVYFTPFSSAHIVMTKPTPFPFADPSNKLSPLLADGSNFPCKGVTYNANGISNKAAVGDDVPLTFEGSAVHGGGSCQISLTTDKNPSKSTKWFVIHSIEGGCPAKDQDGNGHTDQYSFKVPDGVAAGDYILAWTWFNKIGNREMYMNCAPFTVSGGKKRSIEARKEVERMEKRQASFPSMYSAQICGQKCTFPEEDISFPDPGAYVDKFKTDLKPAPLCSCFGDAPTSSSDSSSNSSDASASGSSSAPSSASSGTTGSSSGSGSGSDSGSGASSAAGGKAQATASASADAPTATTTSSSDGSGSGSSDGSASSPSGASTSSGSSSDSAPSAAPSSDSTGSSSGGSTGSAGSTAGSAAGSGAGSLPSQSCSNPGTVVCSSDGKSFGICDTNNKAVMQSVAAGTTCANGQIAAASA